MTFMYVKLAAAPTIPAVSGLHVRTAARVIAALALMAATAWIAYESSVGQADQQMIHEFQLGDRL